MRRARVSLGVGVEGISRERQRLRREAAGWPARIRSATRADLHARDKGRERPRRQHQRRRGGEIVGRDLITRLRDLTLEIYRRGCQHAESKGIIIADTKFEFGLVGSNDEVMLIDEV